MDVLTHLSVLLPGDLFSSSRRQTGRESPRAVPMVLQLLVAFSPRGWARAHPGRPLKSHCEGIGGRAGVCAPRLGSASPVRTRAPSAGVCPRRQTHPQGQELAASYKPNPFHILLRFCQSRAHQLKEKKPNPKAQSCSHFCCHDRSACACKWEMCLVYPAPGLQTLLVVIFCFSTH